MNGPLEGKHIVLGVSGSIASYKAAEIASRLVQEGAIVDVALTFTLSSATNSRLNTSVAIPAFAVTANAIFQPKCFNM